MTTIELPAAATRICPECPWSRTAVRGHLGPVSAVEWCQMAHDEAPIACHRTIKRTNDEGEGDWTDPIIRQCRGAAIFRANIMKSPRNPTDAANEAEVDKVHVFGWDDQFVEYHEQGEPAISCVECGTVTRVESFEDLDDHELACPTCVDDGREDPYCFDRIRLVPCPGSFGVCRGENHHHGDGLHHVPWDRSQVFMHTRSS